MRASEFIVENSDAGTTVSGSIAPVEMSVGPMIRRNAGSFFSGKYMNSADPFPNTPAYMKKGKKRRAS
jgi:hypothetical protein